MSAFVLLLIITFVSVMINRLNKGNEGNSEEQFHNFCISEEAEIADKKQTNYISNSNDIEKEVKNSIKESKISTSEEAYLERPEMSNKNKWLYPTNEFGKMEKGVVD